LYSYLSETPADSVWIQVCDKNDLPIDTVYVERKSGFLLNYWDCQEVEPGFYKVKLHLGEMLMERNAEVKPSPIWPVGHGVEHERSF